MNYVGKLLRDAQPDLLEALIQATKEGDQSRFQALAGSVQSVDEDPEEEFHESESEQEYEVFTLLFHELEHVKNLCNSGVFHFL